jgi:hypothetical protein
MLVEELAKRAGFSGKSFIKTVPSITHKMALRNFANLIIEECIEEIEQYDHHANPSNQTAPIIIQNIRKKFNMEPR